MEKNSFDLTVIYDQPIDRKLKCNICFKDNTLGDMENLPCLHSFCKSCLQQNILILTQSNKFFPIKCPIPDCKSEIFKSYKSILPTEAYERIRSIRKIRKNLLNPAIVWCSTPNCEGYSIQDKKSKSRCNKCDAAVEKLSYHDRNYLLKTFNFAQCPGCHAVIEKELLCISAVCYCGTMFCLKCGELEACHQPLCVIRNNSGNISNLVILLTLYSCILFPWFPALILIHYNATWNKNRLKMIDRYCYILGGVLFIISPIFFLIGMILLPFIATKLCVHCLFDNKSTQGSMKMIFFIVYLAALPAVSLGVFFFCILAILILPLFGLFLLSRTLNNKTNL